MMTTGQPHNKRRAVMIIVGILAVTALGLGIAAGLSTNRQFVLATTRQPESYTELSLNTPGYLPKTATAGEPATFSYNVTNHENSTVLYGPKVTVTENGATHILENDEFILKDGEAKNITVHFTITKPETNYEITVTLPDQDQSVHFRGRS